MPITEPDARMQVAVGVLRRGECLLVQQRMRGTPCAGQWEFPGGKIQPGESAARALQRELREELGVEVTAARRFMTLPFDYAHARVELAVFIVDEFVGAAGGREGQEIRWLRALQIRELNILAAVHPILDALRDIEKLS